VAVPLAVVLAVGAAQAAPWPAGSEAQGREPRQAEPPPEPRRLEWVGVELAPFSTHLGRFPDPFATGRRQPPRWALGVGVDVRAFRFVWPEPRFYFAPVQVGAAVSLAGATTQLYKLGTEVGYHLRRGGFVLEAGAGLGLGGLAIEGEGNCDGSCVIGGLGLIFTPVVRVMAETREDGGGLTAGLLARLLFPVGGGNDTVLGNFQGRATLILVGLDVSYGPVEDVAD
jgi:hypothetical protein